MIGLYFVWFLIALGILKLTADSTKAAGQMVNRFKLQSLRQINNDWLQNFLADVFVVNAD